MSVAKLKPLIDRALTAGTLSEGDVETMRAAIGRRVDDGEQALVNQLKSAVFTDRVQTDGRVSLKSLGRAEGILTSATNIQGFGGTFVNHVTAPVLGTMLLLNAGTANGPAPTAAALMGGVVAIALLPLTAITGFIHGLYNQLVD